MNKALSQLTIWVEGYIHRFASDISVDQENINLKRDHTFRVRDAILDIGNSIGLKGDQLRLAEACALLHDIGRFEQYRKYGTFSDSRSENHAALGVRIIRKYGVLKNFPAYAQKIIIRSVGCHNMAAIPDEKNRDWILFLKLIRDADKVDILYVLTEYYKKSASGSNKALELNLPDIDNISDTVYNALKNGQLALMKNLCSLNDFKLMQMGWVYDLNFLRSFQIFKERKYLDLIYSTLPGSSKKAKDIYKNTKIYLDNNIL